MKITEIRKKITDANKLLKERDSLIVLRNTIERYPLNGDDSSNDSSAQYLYNVEKRIGLLGAELQELFAPEPTVLLPPQPIVLLPPQKVKAKTELEVFQEIATILQVHLQLEPPIEHYSIERHYLRKCILDALNILWNEKN
jgi:hypothetical protein